MAVITADHISKHFRRSTKSKLLREHMAAVFSKDEDDDEERFYALRDVSFQLEPGQALGIIGRNGAGKSTLLNVVTGLGLPDSGTLEVNGKVAALLELGSGFHPDLTGLENLRLNASLLGFTRQETKRLEKEIVEFAELEDFILE